MVRVCRVVPKDWTKYSTLGTVIPRTRFIVFKTPLNDRLLTRVAKDDRFNVSHLLRSLAERGQHLGLVVDLTDTDRYYDKSDIEGMCIEYEKINCPGRGFIENEDHVESFNSAVQQYIEKCEDSEALIGVHCTHGVNRSGYLICRFLIERLGWSSHEALEAFERARGHPIANGSYVQALHRAAMKIRDRGNDSESDSDGRRKKKKKSKRKREEDDSVREMGDLMQNFLGHIAQAAQELEAGGSGYGSPSINGNASYVESPAQQQWTYPAKKQKLLPQPVVDANVSVEDEEVSQDVVDDMVEYDEGDQTLNKNQKRRIRRQKMKDMLHVMSRGNFHEIKEMQEEFLRGRGDI